MNMKIKLFFILFLSIILISCGFKLRSQAVLSKQLGFIYIQKQVPANTLEYYFHNKLLLSGAKLSSDPKQAFIILQLTSPEIKHSRLNSNTDIQTRFYTLTYSVQLTVSIPREKIFIPSKKFSVSHNIVVGADSTLDSTGQLNTAVEEMQNEIISKLVDYLQALSTRFATPH